MVDAVEENPGVASDRRAEAGPNTDGSAPPEDDSAAVVAALSGGGGAQSEIVDVWSRTEPRYRLRAFLLLGVNLALFCGLCVFTFWLREARLFDFSLSAYVAPAEFWASDSPSLNNYLIAPISIERTPEHAVVLGLLLASIVSVPIVIAILYRFLAALPFAAAVFVFAHMPWMAFTLLCSCVLAALPPFRMKFRFASALVAMLPMVAYLYLATRSGSEQLAGTSPSQLSLLGAPWVIAILAAAAMAAVTLGIARLVNYRPGAVAPVVSVMFAAPVILFHARVGVDELDYRVLESRVGPLAPAFRPIQDLRPKLHDLVQQIANDETLYNRHLPDLLAALSGERIPEPRLFLGVFVSDFLAQRAQAYEICAKFIADYPNSRYLPCVLFIQARALDTRLNERMLFGIEPFQELYCDFPHVQSEAVWTALHHEYSQSPLSAAASVRLAQLRLRLGDVAGALEIADAALDRETPSTTQPVTGMLSTEPPEASLAFDPAPYKRELRRMYELILANRDDATHGDRPLVDLASLDSRRAQYATQLLRLADRYRDGLLADNLAVHYAIAQQSLAEREQMLRDLIPRLPEGDALPEALLRLGSIEMRAHPEDASARERGLALLREARERFPGSCWADEASDLLRIYEPAATQ